MCLWPGGVPEPQPLSTSGQQVNRMPMRGASQPRYTWYLAHTPTATPIHPSPHHWTPKVPNSFSSCLPSSWHFYSQTQNTNEGCYCWQYWQLCPLHCLYAMCMFSVLPSLSLLWRLCGLCSVVWALYLCELCVHLWSSPPCIPAPPPLLLVSPPLLWFSFSLWRAGWSTDSAPQSLLC